MRMDIQPLLIIFNKKSIFIGALLMLVVLSGLAVSYSAYENRRLHNKLQQVLDSKNRAQVEWGRLLLEYSTLTSLSRVERLARDELSMEAPQPSSIKMVLP